MIDKQRIRINNFENINCSRCMFNLDDTIVDCKYYGKMRIILFFDNNICCPYYHENFTVLFKKYFYKLLPNKYREYPITREEAMEFHKKKNWD